MTQYHHINGAVSSQAFHILLSFFILLSNMTLSRKLFLSFLFTLLLKPYCFLHALICRSFPVLSTLIFSQDLVIISSLSCNVTCSLSYTFKTRVLSGASLFQFQKV